MKINDKSTNTPTNSKMANNGFNGTVEENAHYWFALIQSDTCSHCDLATYKTWLNANLAHRRAYRELEQLWSLFGDFADQPEIHKLRQQAWQYNPQAVHHLPSRASIQTQTATNRRHISSAAFIARFFPIALAASFLIVFLHVDTHTLHNKENNIFNNAWTAFWNPNTFQTALGEKKTFLLEDGSTLILDTQTQVTTHFTASKRRILLKHGQARFEVAHDKARPFIVEAGSGKITALGTSFVVKKSDADKILVTLLEGKVAVDQEQEELTRKTNTAHPQENVTAVTLIAGQQVAYSNQGMSATARVDLTQATAWQQGRLVFEDHALSDVLKELNRYSNTKILLGNDNSLENINITGVFKTGDNNKVVQTLKTYFDVKTIHDSYGNLVLIPAG